MKDFSIEACWRFRVELPEQIAHRLKSLIALLRPVTPQFARWFFCLSETNCPELTDEENWLVSAVAAAVCTDDLGAPAPALGYLPLMTNVQDSRLLQNDLVWLQTTSGSTFINHARLSASHDLDWDPALVAYPVVKRTMLAVAETFEPLWCTAGPFSLWQDMEMSVYKEGPVIVPCWMTYLSPPMARRITPPSDVISERFADGGLFMAVTDETFDPDRRAHVEAARRLFAVLDTLQEKHPPERRPNWSVSRLS